MNTSSIDPLTPAISKLVGYGWWRFDGDWLDTVEAMQMTPREHLALLHLKTQAWRASPCASLPNDDQALAIFARVDRRTWAAMRAAGRVLRAFVLATDGRLYHPELAEHANRILADRRQERDRKRSDRRSGSRPQPGSRRPADSNRRQADDHPATEPRRSDANEPAAGVGGNQNNRVQSPSRCRGPASSSRSSRCPLPSSTRSI